MMEFTRAEKNLDGFFESSLEKSSKNWNSAGSTKAENEELDPMRKPCAQFLWLGENQDYLTTLEIQKFHWARVSKGAPPIILGLEHSPVITLGKRGSLSQDIQTSFWNTSSSLSQKVTPPILQTDRGGQATLHSPGQLVIYPILPLSMFQNSVKDLVNSLLQVTEIFLNAHGIITYQKKEEPGLFTAHGKIVFCGLRIENKVSRHGLAVNIQNDLSLFQSIRSCGVSQAALDKMENHRKDKISPSLETLFNEWCLHFAGLCLQPSDTPE